MLTIFQLICAYHFHIIKCLILLFMAAEYLLISLNSLIIEHLGYFSFISVIEYIFAHEFVRSFK